MTEIIIPAGGNISCKLPFLRVQNQCPALLPVHTRPLASYIIDFYRKADINISQITLLVEADQLTESEIELEGEGNILKIAPIPTTDGVVETLAYGLTLNNDPDVIVNVVTTIPTSIIPQNSFGIGKTPLSSGSWSSVLLRNGKEFKFLSKELRSNHKAYPFTGVIRGSREALLHACRRSSRQNDLLEVVQVIHEVNPLTYVFLEWIDCGHEINYFDAKANLLNSRLFNSTKVDSLIGSLTKASSNSEKILREANFLQMLPSQLQPLFPRLLDTKLDGSQASYCLEYYGYPNLAEYALFWDLSIDQWQRILDKISGVFTLFREHSYSIGFNAHQKFYFSKVVDRLNILEEQWSDLEHSLLPAVNQPIKINGRLCEPFDILKDKVLQRIEKLYDEQHFCIMHGDLCFGNVLYDLHSGIIRLIDPRGSFGEDCIGIYGDPKYDVAKLAHSAIWGYDYFVNGLFKLSHEENAIIYHLNWRKNASSISFMVEQMIENLGYRFNDIRLIVALLFIAMAPLHNDSIDRQVALYAHGLNLLNQELVGD
jgi:hypothetical protein